MSAAPAVSGSLSVSLDDLFDQGRKARMPFDFSFMLRETCSGDVSSFEEAGFFSSGVAGRPSEVVREASRVGSALMLEGTLSGLTCRCLCIYVCECGAEAPGGINESTRRKVLSQCLIT